MFFFFLYIFCSAKDHVIVLLDVVVSTLVITQICHEIFYFCWLMTRGGDIMNWVGNLNPIDGDVVCYCMIMETFCFFFFFSINSFFELWIVTLIFWKSWYSWKCCLPFDLHVCVQMWSCVRKAWFCVRSKLFCCFGIWYLSSQVSRLLTREEKKSLWSFNTLDIWIFLNVVYIQMSLTNHIFPLLLHCLKVINLYIFFFKWR